MHACMHATHPPTFWKTSSNKVEQTSVVGMPIKPGLIYPLYTPPLTPSGRCMVWDETATAVKDSRLFVNKLPYPEGRKEKGGKGSGWGGL